MPDPETNHGLEEWTVVIRRPGREAVVVLRQRANR
jgi:hypothetical protein